MRHFNENPLNSGPTTKIWFWATSVSSVKLKFHGTIFCTRILARILARMLRGRYSETGPVKFQLATCSYRSSSVFVLSVELSVCW